MALFFFKEELVYGNNEDNIVWAVLRKKLTASKRLSSQLWMTLNKTLSIQERAI